MDVTRQGGRAAHGAARSGGDGPHPGVRVLLCRPDHLGDVLLALPGVALLRAALPDAHLAFAVAPGLADIVERCPHGDETGALPWPPPNPPGAPAAWAAVVRAAAPRLAGRFDVALLLRPDDPWSGLLVARAGVGVRMGFDQPRTAPFLTDVLPEPKGRHVRSLGTTLAAETLTRLGRAVPRTAPQALLQSTPQDVAEAEAVLGDAGDAGDAPIVLHPGSGWPLKNWPVARWAQLAVALRDRCGATSLVLGSGEEAGIVAAVVDAAGGAAVAGPALSLPGLAAVHAEARLVITTDSGAAHLAAMTGAAVVALFGPGDPVTYRPSCPPARLRVVRVGLACSPCGTLEDPPCGAVTDPACVTGLGLDAVLAAAEELLGGQRRAVDYVAP